MRFQTSTWLVIASALRAVLIFCFLGSSEMAFCVFELFSLCSTVRSIQHGNDYAVNIIPEYPKWTSFCTEASVAQLAISKSTQKLPLPTCGVRPGTLQHHNEPIDFLSCCYSLQIFLSGRDASASTSTRPWLNQYASMTEICFWAETIG